MSIILYGIKNCDTVKKARRWLEAHQINYAFHDFRVDGLNKELLKDFMNHFELEILINKRGTTWRKLPDEHKENIDQKNALELMVEFPTLIKRPILVGTGMYYIGFDENKYEKLLK